MMIKLICLILALLTLSAQLCQTSSVRFKNQSKANKSPILDDKLNDDDEVNNNIDSENSTSSPFQVDIIMDLTSDKFNQDCLKAHNNLRKMVGASELKLSRKAIKYARKRALKLAEENDFDHPRHDPGNYGENIMVWPDNGASIDCSLLVKLWFDEYKLVSNWSDPEAAGLATYHFTQIAWKETKLLGCGAASKQYTGWIYVNCNYDPPGNYLNEFGINVNPPYELLDEREIKNEINNTYLTEKGKNDDRCECVCEVR